MVPGMLLAGLRRCEVPGLRSCDVQVADRRLAVAEGKGGHHRIVPAANRFFGAPGACLHAERPGAARTDRVLAGLKGPRRGLPLPAEGPDEILAGARRRARLEPGLPRAAAHVPDPAAKGAELHRMQHSAIGVRTAPQGCRSEHGAAAIAATGRTRRPGGPDRTALRQMPGCCVHSGCIRRKHDAVRETKKRSDEGSCPYRPGARLTHSA
jgi:hypothetical protein